VTVKGRRIAITRLPNQPADQAPAGDATCPLRPGDGCRMCVPGASGPWDCGLVFLVTTDPDLRAKLTPG
jgi:hypothetical protein